MRISKSPVDSTNRLSRGVTLGRRGVLLLMTGGLTGIALPRVWADFENKPVILYKDPECSCCEGYAAYLTRNGFKVGLVPTHDLPLLDEKYGIPTDLQPCHLSLMGPYIVGGHVPIEIVNRLLSEKPAITGITLPGMPMGSPGMTGRKTEPFTIYEIAKNSRKVYAVV